MGYLLKEALKTVCGVNQWSYAVFWKTGCQNPKLLIWEECYYEPIQYPALSHISGIESPDLAFEDWESCWVPAEARSSHLGVQAQEKVHSLMNKMMIDNHINVVGEGLVGRAAFTGKHQWILSEKYDREAHPPEVLSQVRQQFSAGMQTVAVIPVLTHGVVQLGSSLAIMENMGFVNHVKTLILQLGCVPGALLSENYTAEEPDFKIGVPVCPGKSVSADVTGNYKVMNAIPFAAESCSQQSISCPASGLDQPCHSLTRHMQNNLQSAASTFETPNLTQNSVKYHEDSCQQEVLPAMKGDLPFRSLDNRVTGPEVMPSNSEVWMNQQPSLYTSISGFDQHPCVDPSSANCSSLRLMEEHILPDAGVREHTNNSLSTSSGFIASQLRSNGGLISSSFEDPITNPSLEGSQLPNGVGSHLRSMSNPCSLPNSHRAANSNISCAHLAGSGHQNAGSSKTAVLTSDLVDHLTTSHSLSCISDRRHHHTKDKSTEIELAWRKEKVENDLFQALFIPSAHLDEQIGSSVHIPGFLHESQKHDHGHQSSRSENAKYEDACVETPSGDDLFDILGVNFKNKLFNTGWNNALNNGPDSNTKKLGRNNDTSMNIQDGISELYSVDGGNSNSGIFSPTASDHLLDAVVSSVHSASKQSSDDNLSSRKTLTKIGRYSVPNASPPYGSLNAPDQLQGELFGISKSLSKAGAVGTSSFRSECSGENAGTYSQTTSIYGSQISSCIERGHNMKHNSSISTGYSKRPEEASKTNRKRLKPGENPRPRPKDRQMIQDRVKELREIVPNGAKCSIDALLERTIKHMLFLQSVTKHADKLKQTGDSKIISKEGGLLLKDNFEGGATWAYEVGSQSMVCPIIVEDLNPPRQMLVEMLCEERGLFLEIADIIRGLGLTILKGVMETRNDKIWARFAVEANRDVTRMEIFISLVRLLEQTIKCSAVNDIDHDNMMLHQSFHQAASIPATGRHCSFQ
ncbi:transcription factor LHW [Cornus florida]|uniref:transcription factor LHW n=1 Tax=Cornus florida TaxID=4283 RepID=UPI0028A0671C|nr:transcription factor LHW [Cornus florida]